MEPGRNFPQLKNPVHVPDIILWLNSFSSSAHSALAVGEKWFQKEWKRAVLQQALDLSQPTHSRDEVNE
jgi:hypothetical protein